ncbi:MAG: nucleotidyl transferase AbiEii/AbiGii toxin family protein [bacterium]|jgi:predicted nucleotidyltransferase component of viral defense system|nr:nucleotidyl transferase AbiEii/AbiGii toxin family protein [candidate division KSB1 bacterium]MDH7560417.1 nucleotidyl transferase AbiEii/AbiGii toxin family protein [bacterium]
MLWQQLTELAKEQRLPLSIVLAEALHLAVLQALFTRPQSDRIAFQGGTCLHLVYGGYRYSEDLDFAGKEIDRPFCDRLVEEARSPIEKAVVQMLGLGSFEWRFPETTRGAKVSAYWFLFQPQGQRQRYRLKIQFGQFPVYQVEARPVRSQMDVLSRQPLVVALSPAELLAEKLAALYGRRFLKGRDVLDIWYLTEVLKAPLDRDLVARNLQDYGVRMSPESCRQRIALIASSSLAAEMARFLPERYRTHLARNDYEAVRRKMLAVGEEVARTL